ncbi:hypothetical protein [Paenibacillus polymyxa]|uniref:hypothetical protein n=1 Tax=Paenibacillus polymyxa TaxID=1406 RepID=UPI002AB5D4D2|nr:hypothetical protein [Paenibacillus polymyxa]MDY8021155.1 hypothetical protein [Paenibacillus polymyxa]
MNIEEIATSKSWWFQDDLDYHMDENWQTNKNKPENYVNFTYWEQFLLRTPLLYFRIVIRKHLEERRITAKSDEFRKKYSVIVAGADCEIPLPLKIWEEYREPWDYRTSTYINPWMVGEKYRHHPDFINYERSGVTHATHIKGFDDFFDAQVFAEKWKDLLLIDFKDKLKKSKEIMKLIK